MWITWIETNLNEYEFGQKKPPHKIIAFPLVLTFISQTYELNGVLNSIMGCWELFFGS